MKIRSVEALKRRFTSPRKVRDGIDSGKCNLRNLGRISFRDAILVLMLLINELNTI